MNSQKTSHVREYIVFSVADTFCALNINDVQEIKRFTDITTVHHAPNYVRGVINLRGQIVTVIDLCKKLNYDNDKPDIEKRIVIIKQGEEYIGLLVDSIEDAITADPDEILPPPSNVNYPENRFFIGVYKLENALVAILDKNSILNPDTVDEQNGQEQSFE